MNKRILRLITLALCLCLLLSMSLSATANTGELIDVSDGAGSGTTEPPGDGGGTTTPDPEPPPEAKYIITIAAPRGWSRKTATVTVKLEDENSVGFAKAEAKFGSNGAWQDISDSLRSYGWAQVEISENGTVYVSVTDKTGKAHVKSLYIECFDREAPTIKAKTEGNSLRAEAEDDLSGVEYIYVNGYSFDYLTDGTLDVRLREYAETDEESVFVYAVDYAGNKSKTVELKNPLYKPPESEKPETSQPAATTPPATVTPQVPVVTAPTASQPAASAPAQTAPVQEDKPTDNGSVTPTDGTGTVIENSVKTPEQREFFTITTEAGNDFYIVVDKQKDDNNVYLLSAVTEDTLSGLAEKSETPEAATLTPTPAPPPVQEPAPVVTPAPEPEPDPEPEPEPEPAPAEPTPEALEKSGDGGTVAIVVVIMLACGGIGYYFKIVRPKRDMYVDEDEDESADPIPADTGDGLNFAQNGGQPAAQADEQDDE